MAQVRIDTGAIATVYVSIAEHQIAEFTSVLAFLDAHHIEAICCRIGDTSDAERLIRNCDGVIAITPGARAQRDQELALMHGVPSISISANDHHSLEAFVNRICAFEPLKRPFAFLAARMHPDFRLIREAIGDAVETTLGLPCIWFDDPRAVAPECGVRERTQMMIRDCSLFLADLTYSPNNPDHDSPNTAHEIGMALAYDRPVVLSCQEPRRDLYFSAGDLHTVFWEHEAHLRTEMKECFRSRYAMLGRRLLNLEVPRNPAGFSGAFPRHRFEMDWADRYRPPASISPALKRSRLAPHAQECLHAVRREPAGWKAVWHPLGFMDIELFDDGADCLRLHVWSEVAGPYRSSGLAIHKHDWSMSSHVICGSIENRIYQIVIGEAATHRVYSIEYHGNANRLRATDQVVHCRLREASRIHSGETYTIAPDVFHDLALPGQGTVATLVRGIRHASFDNEVLGPMDGRAVYETERVRCEPHAVREAIDLVLQQCQQAL